MDGRPAVVGDEGGEQIQPAQGTGPVQAPDFVAGRRVLPGQPLPAPFEKHSSIIGVDQPLNKLGDGQGL